MDIAKEDILKKVDLPDYVLRDSIEKLKNLDTEVQCQIEKYEIYYKLCGTVFSGATLRTTFGNTMRVYMYLKFICSKAKMNIDDFEIFVSGDD